MIQVKVRGDEVINLFQAHDFRGQFVNAPGIPPTRHAGIDKTRFSYRSYHERSTTTFGVHPVDIKSAGFLVGKHWCGGEKSHGGDEREGT